MRYYLLLAVWLPTCSLFAQLDTTLTARYGDLADSLSAVGDYSASLQYCQLLDTLYRRHLLPGDNRRTEVLDGIGTLQYYLGHPDSAALAFRAGVAWAEAGDETAPKQLIQLYNNLAVVLPGIGQFDGALAAAERALHLYKERIGEMPDPALVERYACVGRVYQQLAQPRPAVDYHHRAERVCRALPPGPDRDLTLGLTLSDLGQCYDQLGDYERAADLQRTGLGLLETHLPPDHALLPGFRNNLAVVLDKMGRHTEARQLHRTTLDQRRASLGEQHAALAESYNNLAMSYIDEERYAVALPYLQRALDALPAPGAVSPLVGTLYDNLAAVYQQLGDPVRALAVRQQALAELRRTLPLGHRSIGTSAYNVGLLYNATHRYDEALPYLREGLSTLAAELPDDHPRVLSMYDGIAHALIGTGEFERADSLLVAGIEATLARPVPDTTTAITLLLRAANPRLYGGSADAALARIDRAVQLLDQEHNKRGQRGAAVLLRAAIGQSRAGRHGPAMAYADLAREAYGLVDPVDWSKQPTPLSALVDVPTFVEVYTAAYRRTGRVEYDELALRMLEVGEQGLADLRSRVADPTGLLDVGRRLQEAALTHQYARWQQRADTASVAAMIGAAERCHAETLRRTLRRAALGGAELLPDSLVDARARLADERRRWNTVARSATTSNGARAEATAKAVAALEEETALLAAARRAYPQYFAALSQDEMPSTATLQRKLTGPDRAALSYVVSDSVFFALLLRSDTVIVRVGKVAEDSLTALVERCVSVGITAFYGLTPTRRLPAMRVRTTRQFTEAAQTLHELLLAPFGAALPDTLLIVPDGPLAGLPFEALISEPPGRVGVWRSYPFVLHRHWISYGYSLGLQARATTTVPATPPRWVGLAPFADDANGNPATRRGDPDGYRPAPLPQSGPEVRLAARLTGGEGYYGQAADRDRFERESPRADMLHLATHAVADRRYGEESFLRFADTIARGRLYAHELYNRQLPARLVVLSACETALGNYLPGEGLLGLERGFAYAGVEALVATLWPVDDTKTADLMGEFYRTLLTGYRSGHALTAAKRRYLTDPTTSNEGQHPYFWAGLVHKGHNGVLYP